MLKRVLAMALVACAAIVPPARAQLPDRTLRIIGGFAPGGTSDLVARLIANAVAPLLDRNVVVENRTGANGFIAAEAVVRGDADGSVLFQCPMGTMTISPELPGLPMPIDPRKDLIPVANVALSSYGAVVRAGGPYSSMEAFLAAAQAKPGGLSYASAGIGTAQHLSGERLQRMAGIKLLHVPYRGAAPAALDIMAGRADFMVTNLGDVISQVQGGKLRLVALGDASMKSTFPEVPLLSDSVPGLEIAGWFGLCGPRGMPDAAVSAWADATKRALQDAALQKQLRDNGLTPLFEGPEAFGARMAQDRKAWGEVIAAAGVRVD
ncbi:tripartite tricarboxylate transporter substrate binding protein [Roseomonas sp. E05]|uniref:Bug family tripartite tricarboxylate transporter substrate binding protein n=1 Tax=Roseomonas sp. E05 TaxID=3046310 RepID=UPI0024B98234|nr:tripartite tricarboxylate transporter substrate binding protein [Roseomonas sp. E05]MDJ0390799.1 tripartite tricarboxylate transporter substrate binding protein [Roseomonas sp. E05]